MKKGEKEIKVSEGDIILHQQSWGNLNHRNIREDSVSRLNTNISRDNDLLLLKNLTNEQVKEQRSGPVCVLYECVCMCPLLLLSPIISPCIDDSLHICSAFLWGPGGDESILRQNDSTGFLFALPASPHSYPQTDSLLSGWGPVCLNSSSLLSSLLVPVIWCEWMLMPEGLPPHCFHPSTQILIREKEGRREARKVRKRDLFGVLEWAPRRHAAYRFQKVNYTEKRSSW